MEKKIHYCWFGGNQLSEKEIKCIESWRKFFPDYEIVEWNENNFDIHICKYVEEAYQAKKWAFVSDYARFWILYNYGGLYFDTDVEVINSFDDIIDNGCFMGCEQSDNGLVVINPGLGISAIPGLKIYKDILDYYKGLHFLREDGSYNLTTIVTYTSNIFKRNGWKANNIRQEVEGVVIYPQDYFSPKNYRTGEIVITNNTRSIHHYTESWHSDEDKEYLILQKKLQKVLPRKVASYFSKFACVCKYRGIYVAIKMLMGWIKRRL